MRKFQLPFLSVRTFLLQSLTSYSHLSFQVVFWLSLFTYRNQKGKSFSSEFQRHSFIVFQFWVLLSKRSMSFSFLFLTYLLIYSFIIIITLEVVLTPGHKWSSCLSFSRSPPSVVLGVEPRAWAISPSQPFFFFFWDRISLWSSDWPWPKDPSASPSQVL
jgi:hypothetical protein